MSRQQRIESALRSGLQPSHLAVEDESGGHNVPAGSESHFRVVIVADSFADRNQVARHRQVYEALAEEFTAGLHALSLHTYSPDEWQLRPEAPASPPCEGGERAHS